MVAFLHTWLLAVLVLAPPAGETAYDTYVVPAGTALTLQLRSSASSSDSRTGEQVTATLMLAIARGEVELVPAGSKVFGTIVEREAHAGSKPGRIGIRFHVVEHAVTGSRAAIRTELIAAEGGQVKARKFGVPVMRGTEAAIQAGSIVSCNLEEPLRVMIPKK
jgi:hypothetical protein